MSALAGSLENIFILNCESELLFMKRMSPARTSSGVCFSNYICPPIAGPNGGL